MARARKEGCPVNLYFRLFMLLLKSLAARARLPWSATTSLGLRVLPHDLDLNFHLNNGRYLTMMDLGRLDYLGQTGMLKTCIKRKWLPILGATQMTYLRPLKLFQTFTIDTEIEYWDEKWVVMRQRYYSKGKLVASGRVRALMRGPQGNVPPAEILAASGISDPTPPPISDEVRHWLASLNSLKAS